VGTRPENGKLVGLRSKPGLYSVGISLGNRSENYATSNGSKSKDRMGKLTKYVPTTSTTSDAWTRRGSLTTLSVS
jgi:hypothetical protein